MTSVVLFAVALLVLGLGTVVLVAGVDDGAIGTSLIGAAVILAAFFAALFIGRYAV